jgi:hypothetical protein
LSIPSGLKIPEEVCSLRVSPASSTMSGFRVNGPAGDALK